MENHKKCICEDICSLNISQKYRETVVTIERTIGECVTVGDNLVQSLCSSWQ